MNTKYVVILLAVFAVVALVVVAFLGYLGDSEKLKAEPTMSRDGRAWVTFRNEGDLPARRCVTIGVFYAVMYNSGGVGNCPAGAVADKAKVCSGIVGVGDEKKVQVLFSGSSRINSSKCRNFLADYAEAARYLAPSEERTAEILMAVGGYGRKKPDPKVCWADVLCNEE